LCHSVYVADTSTHPVKEDYQMH